MSDLIVLYGTPFSFYTGKVRAYLLYKQLPFTEVFSTLKIFKKIIVPKTGRRMVPVVKTPEGEYLQDSALIIDTFEQRYPQPSVIPSGPKQRLVSYLFELFADEWLLIPALHYRWNKNNFPFIHREFGGIVGAWLPGFARGIVGKKIGKKFEAYLPMLGITSSIAPAIEAWYEDEMLSDLDVHFKAYPYLLGDVPTLGDFCLMGPLYAHLYRDPAPAKIMREKAPNVVRWVERMNCPKGQSDRPLSEGDVPETLFPIIERIFEEQWPAMVDTAHAMNKWAREHPNKQIPRSIGTHRYRIGAVTEQRGILSFQQWKLQRVLDCYAKVRLEDKRDVDNFLLSVGGLEAMQLEIDRPVKFENNRLAFI